MFKSFVEIMKNLLKGLSEDLRNGEIWLQIKNLNIIKVSVSPNYYRFNVIQIKIPKGFFFKNLTSKFCWKSKGSSIAETFSNKINVENLSSKISWIIINFKYLGQYDTGIVIDQWNQIRANIYLHAYIYGTVIDHRCAIIEHCKYAWIVPKRCSNNCLLIWGGKKWNTTLHYTQKNTFNGNKDFNMKSKTLKFFDENIGK